MKNKTCTDVQELHDPGEGVVPGKAPRPLALCFWTLCANHYQSAFFNAMRARGHDVRVCYASQVGAARRAMFWSGDADLPPGEFIVSGWADALRHIPDLAARIHTPPGNTGPMAREILRHLIRERVEWMHWSEPNQPGLRRWIGLPLRRFYGSLVRRHGLGALAIGRNAARDFQRWGVPPHRIVFLPYSTPERQDPLVVDEQTRQFVGDDLAFVYCGRLSLAKGTDLLLKAFDALGAEGAKTKLVLIGVDASGGSLPALAKQLPCRDRILLRGPVPPGAVDGVLACCHVCVLPSLKDGWGLALCEGARNGLALIGSDRSGASFHIIEPGLNGMVIRTGNLEALTNAMQVYARDRDLARRHGIESLGLHRRVAPATNARRFEYAVRMLRAARGVDRR